MTSLPKTGKCRWDTGHQLIHRYQLIHQPVWKGGIRLCGESEHQDAPLAYTSSKIPHQQAVRLSIQFWCCYFLTGALIQTKPSYVFVSLNYKNEEYLNSLLFPLQGKKHLAKQHTGYLCFLRAMPVFPSFRHETREKNPCSLLVLDHLCTVMNSPDCLQELWG